MRDARAKRERKRRRRTAIGPSGNVLTISAIGGRSPSGSCTTPCHDQSVPTIDAAEQGSSASDRSSRTTASRSPASDCGWPQSCLHLGRRRRAHIHPYPITHTDAHPPPVAAPQQTPPVPLPAHPPQPPQPQEGPSSQNQPGPVTTRPRSSDAKTSTTRTPRRNCVSFRPRPFNSNPRQSYAD